MSDQPVHAIGCPHATHTNRPTVKGSSHGNAQWLRTDRTLPLLWSQTDSLPSSGYLMSLNSIQRDRQTMTVFFYPLFSLPSAHSVHTFAPFLSQDWTACTDVCKCLKRPGAYTPTLVCTIQLWESGTEINRLKWLQRSPHLWVVCLLVGLLNLFVFTSCEFGANLLWISM